MEKNDEEGMPSVVRTLRMSGHFQPLCFCFLTGSKCHDLRLQRNIYIGSLRVRRLCGHVLGKDLLQLRHCKPQRGEEGSLGSLFAGTHQSQCPTFQHCDISSYYFTVWTTVVERWGDRKHLMWLLLKTIYITFINFSSLFFHYGS